MVHLPPLSLYKIAHKRSMNALAHRAAAVIRSEIHNARYISSERACHERERELELLSNRSI